MLYKTTFVSDNSKLVGMLSLAEVPVNCGVVFLHGGGHANFTRYKYLQERMLEKGIASLAFDMRGCGESEGNFAESTLINRERDTRQAVKLLIEKANIRTNQLYIWGSSMGAHTACKLCNELQLKGVILQSPAAYGKQVENLPLGEQFTQEITKPNSWENSPAFSELKKFAGRVLVLFGKNDDVIPKGVKQKYKEIIKPTDQYTILSGGTHKLLRPEDEDGEKAFYEMTDVALEFINNQLL